MGNTQCASEKKDNYLWSIIQRKLVNKETPLDKKIHNEYMSLIGLQDHRFENELSLKKNIISHIKEEKRISRFKKWYYMSFLKEIISNNEKNCLVDSTPRRQNNNKTVTTPKISTENNNNKHSDDLSDNNFSKTTTNLNCINLRVNDKFNFKDEMENNSFTINQAEIGLRKFMKENKKRFINRLIKGPPDTFRWISWILAAELPENRNQEIFKSLLKIDLDKKTDIQIKKDLNRTLSEENLIFFGNLQNSLYNVLKAYANSDKEVSYCQGMNFIAGFLLIISDFNEIDTLHMMMSLFMFTFGEDNLGIRGFYINEFPLLKLYVYVFEVIFNKFLPELKQHFDKLEVPNELWISKWFQTLFTVCIPLDMLVRVWDCFLALGLDFLISFSISLLKKHEKNLISFLDISDISQYFRNMNPNLTKEEERIKFDVEELISSALEIKIPKTLLNSLKIEYEKKYNVDLTNLKIKYDMKILDSASKDLIENQVELKNNSNLDYILNNLNCLEIKLDLNSKFSSITNNEEMKKSTNHYSSINKIDESEEIENSCDLNDDTINSICSEFNLFENNAVTQKVKAHTFRMKMGKREEIEVKGNTDSKK